MTLHLDGPRGRGLTDSLISFPFLVPLFDSAVSKEPEKKSKAGVLCIRAGGRPHLHQHRSRLSLERQAWSPSELLMAVRPCLAWLPGLRLLLKVTTAAL